MSVLTLPGPGTSAPPTAPPALPRRKRWTVAEFHQLWEQGWFERSRPMLLDGEIYEMAIPGPLHNAGVRLADYLLKAVFAQGFVVRIQMPLVLGQWSDPVPDLAVLTGRVRDYVATQPTTAVLVVEVADTSLATDRGEKSQLSAAAGIADYWVVDLNNGLLIVHRDPQPDPASASGTSYRTITALAAGQSVSALAASQTTVNVVDLLP